VTEEKRILAESKQEEHWKQSELEGTVHKWEVGWADWDPVWVTQWSGELRRGSAYGLGWLVSSLELPRPFALYMLWRDVYCKHRQST